MSRTPWGLLLALVLSGCSRCNAPGPEHPVARADAGSHRSTDLRTAVFAAFPEFRGAHVLGGRAELARRFDRPVALSEQLVGAVQRNGFVGGVDAGAWWGIREPFRFQIDGDRLVIWLPIGDADVSKLLGAPSAMTTEQLATWFPKVEGATVIHEQFRLQLRYEAVGWRAGFLAWQMVDLNTQGSWKVDRWPEGYEHTRRADGGGGVTPEEYSLELKDSTTGALIEVHRDHALIDVAFLLDTEGGQ